MNAIDYKSAPFAALVRSVLEESPICASILQLTIRGKGSREIGREIACTFAPGGEADNIIGKLEDPKAARVYCREIVRRFRPYRDILHKAIPHDGRWKCKSASGGWVYVNDKPDASPPQEPPDECCGFKQNAICDGAGSPATQN